MAVRPWSFPASAMPVVVALAFLWWKEWEMDWVNGVWALVNIVLFHAAGNTWSDYFDFRHQVDTKESSSVPSLTEGVFRPGEVMRLSVGLLVVAVAGGIGLLARTGWPLLYIGVAGVLLSLLYPSLKYRAWGDFVIFINYSLLPMLGTAYVVTGNLLWDVLWLALPVGLITVAILHANNTRDIQTDREASIRTLAMELGAVASVRLYAFEVLLPFAWVVLCCCFSVLPPLSLLVFVAFGMAWRNVCRMKSLFKGGREGIADLDQRTAQLQLVFSLLLVVSFVISRLLW